VHDLGDWKVLTVIDSKLSRLCDGLLEAGWLAAIIAVPLFFNIHSERVFEPDKLTLLRSIAIFMATIWIVKSVDQRGWKNLNGLSWRNQASIWRQPFVMPIVALIVIYLVATLFSITPRVSWAGSYQRLQGTYTTLSYIIIAGVAASTIRSRVQIGRVVTAVIITSIPVSFYGLLQHFGLDPLPWGGDVIARVAGHMGNAIFIAAYLIIVLPLTLGRIVDAFTNILGDEQLSIADVIRSAIYIFVLAIQLLAVYWSGSRGPLIGLAVALFSFTLVLLVSLRDAAGDKGAFGFKDTMWAIALVIPAIIALLLANALMRTVSSWASFAVFFGVIALSVLAIFLLLALQRGWRWLWLSWLLLTAFVAGWLLLFNVPSQRLTVLREAPVIGGVLETQIAWKELPTVGSYGRMLDPSQTAGREKSNRVRVLIWQGVVELIKPHDPLTFPDGRVDTFNFLRPLIGYGPESMYVAYNRFYPSELASVEARNATPDRSHNETFDALVITGLAGFLAWQALYVSVFYFGFRYLGAIRSRRDSIILIGAWIGGGLLGAILSLTVFDPVYLGVAIPTGTIVGLVGYLFYYAIFSEGRDRNQVAHEGQAWPFHVDRLLMNALLAAVLAHYAEIHFGIAISATRLYFFLYVALMFLISYKIPKETVQEITVRPTRRKKRGTQKRVTAQQQESWGPVLLWAFLLALLIGILGFEFTNFVLPIGSTIESGADLRAVEIFNQSLFVNTQKGFLNSPFIFLMIVLVWALGYLIAISEMIKQGELKFKLTSLPGLSSFNQRLVVAGFGVLVLAVLALWILSPVVNDATVSLGRRLALLGAIACLWAAVRLWQNSETGRVEAAIVAAGLIVLSIPVMMAGGWIVGGTTILLCGAMLYLLWDKKLGRIILPSTILGALSLLIGLTFTMAHAVSLREALLYLIFFQEIEPISSLYTLFFRPTGLIDSVAELRVLEARQAMRFLASFYIFLFTMVILSGVSLAWRAIKNSRFRGSIAGYASLVVVSIVAIMIISQTNMRVVQADMVYKRGKPYDEQAIGQNDPLNWDVAIAIYEEALDLAQWEDFYYLFLGRAYLERSAVTEDSAEKASLYSAAEAGLLKAQDLNPLNTDHTANLARLYSRWFAAEPDENGSDLRLKAAEGYYQDALTLSPQNSIIRNEYARLAFDLGRDCDRALALYEESLAVDPFYVDTYFAITDALVACAEAQTDEADKRELYELAIQYLSEGLSRDLTIGRGWLLAGQIYQKLGQYEDALSAFEQLRESGSDSTVTSWNIDFAEARVHRDLGDVAMARALAEQAQRSAPSNVTNQIEAFLQGLGEE
jgi:Tfp pilus assembly protein PilF